MPHSPMHCVHTSSGTHDVQNISVVAINDEIQIEGHYIDNSEAEGLLVIMYNTNDSTPQYYLIPRHKSGPKRRKIHYRLTEVGAGELSVSTFVVEKNGLPFSQVATPPKAVFIPNSLSKLNEWLTAQAMIPNLICIIRAFQVKYNQHVSSTAFSPPQIVFVSLVTSNKALQQQTVWL